MDHLKIIFSLRNPTYNFLKPQQFIVIVKYMKYILEKHAKDGIQFLKAASHLKNKL